MTAASFSFAATLTSNDVQTVHVLNRLAYGPRPGDIEQVNRMGVMRYIDQQLQPERIPLPQELEQRLQALDVAQAPAGQTVADYVNARKTARENANDENAKAQERINRQTAEARLIRAIDSPRQLQEVMVDFWFNHFNVFAGKDLVRPLIASYERDAIRPYALGHFRDLLGATAKHPAMLFYLDNWLSVVDQPEETDKPNKKRTGLNENYARELMELHTLGVDNGYTQQDVTALARILTGWTFNRQALMQNNQMFVFDARRHDQGVKQWLGMSISPQGQVEGEQALDHLASSPATARHLSQELAQYFVSDTPPPALVKRMAQRYLQTDGDIREVLRTLFHSKEFMDAANIGNKYKTPYQYVISSLRATGISVTNVQPILNNLNQLGMPLYGCQTPDGYKNTQEAWLNPDALTRRITYAGDLGSGRLIQRLQQTEQTPDAAKSKPQAPDADALLQTLGNSIGEKTRAVIDMQAPPLRAALILGSPDFMQK
ncbi:DUF1800 domain-containing protein [uncultured Oxalicibacterium sp.]|uniref:DUF1800 domain-containing protein n=1 Tax=uncultured Oxalicibacterium sp. TaxID=1168540 RepID=UPI0025D5B40A|nr:DUF1800 domain-containing protein [uncultured Oxalicibacterium sp.]